MRKPRFGKCYTGDWPYESSAGVGLSFQGVPTDYKKFLDIVMGESCNPVSARRILKILESGEKKYVTVMDGLNFEYIWESLKEIGVTMEVTPPYEYEKEGYDYIQKNSEIDRAVLETIKNKDNSVDLKDINIEIYEERLKATRESLEVQPHNFGRYE